MQKVAFVTYEQAPTLTADDALIRPLLAERNIEVIPAVWSDPRIRWIDFETVVFRSCWDYHLQPHDFRQWVLLLKELGVRVWNSPRIVLWNMDKRYLNDLARNGVKIPKTIWLEPGISFGLCTWMREQVLEKVIIKPAISATAYKTWLLSRADVLHFQSRFQEILRTGSVLIQEYLPEVSLDGEWSLVFIGGQFSHAVIKRAKKGDYRVQSEFGGSVVSETPPENLIRQAEAIMTAIDTPLLYARVDGVEHQDEFILIELELIEPELFLCLDAEAPERFARAISMVLE